MVSTSKLAPDSLDTALLDSATTHSILRHPDYFEFEHTDSLWQTCELTTIAGKCNLKFKEGRAKLLLPRGTSLTLARAMYAPAAPRNLISYKDLRAQDVHLTTEGVKGEEAIELRRRGVTLATATAGATGLYNVKICPPTGRAQSRQRSTFAITNFEPPKAIDGDDRAPRLRRDQVPERLLSDQNLVAGSKLKRSSAVKADLCRKAQRVLSDALPYRQSPHSRPAVVNWGTNAQAMDAVFIGDTPMKSGLWHDRLGHPSATMLRRMIPILEGHPLCTRDAEHTCRCSACAQGKFSIKASQWKLPHELPPPLERLQGDICGPITPMSGPFQYFFVLVDASGKHVEVSLLSTRNLAFPKLLAMIIKIKAHHPEVRIKTLKMVNAGEFKSKTFKDFCTATSIHLTYSVPYEHSQNGLTEAYIKKLQMVARPLLLHAKLLATLWGHAILHAAALLRLRPTLLNPITFQQLLTGRTPDVSHLRIFGCKVWVPWLEPLRRTISALREEGVYMGFDSPSILRYFVPSTGALLKACFQNCIFEENVFPHVPCPKGIPDLNFYSPQTFILNPNPRTSLSETEVQKILHLQALADRLLDGFSDAPRVTRLPTPGTGFKRKILALHTDAVLQTTENAREKPDPLILEEAQRCDEWLQWEAALHEEYDSLKKHKVFGEYSHTLNTRPMGHKLIFTKKRDAQGRVLQFKVRLVAQGFS